MREYVFKVAVAGLLLGALSACETTEGPSLTDDPMAPQNLPSVGAGVATLPPAPTGYGVSQPGVQPMGGAVAPAGVYATNQYGSGTRASCNAEAAGGVIGDLATLQTQQQVESATGNSNIRVISPGVPNTTDYDGSRLNIETDSSNKVVGLRCG